MDIEMERSAKQLSIKDSVFKVIATGLAKGVTGQFLELLRFQNVEYVKQHARPGDLLEFHRGLFSHYALYLGNGKVMNICAEEASITSALIKEMLLEAVCLDSRVRIRNHDTEANKYFGVHPRSTKEIIRAAKSYANKKVTYEFDFRNCEYYSTLWRYGKGFSTQVAKPTLTPPGSVLEEIIKSTRSSTAFLNAAEDFIEMGVYSRYRQLIQS